MIYYDAARNVCQALPPGAFLRVPLLQKLDLTGVVIPAAHGTGLLAPLRKLIELKWARGGLTQVPEDVYGMHDLRILKLNDNKIFSISADVARGLLRTSTRPT